ncbi:hypothetical protein [Emcibacter sp. SYSU 3D8]|uniref:hypothetical protein n=1 Tax=Emcibacter sp. SYSU 3D8 TaxID=3133969 RepID=UPI0031FF431E
MAGFGWKLTRPFSGRAARNPAKASRPEQRARTIAPVEILPKWLLFTPMTIQWFWLGFKYRSITLPSVVNPGIETGGLVGESKFACLELVAPRFRDRVADTALVAAGADPEAVRLAAGLGYPLIAKPDIGWCGYGVRRIDTETELRRYAAAFPPGEAFLLQRLIDQPHEAALFYIRHPSNPRGRVIALTVRHLPHVIGDGARDVAALVASDLRMARNAADYEETLGPAGMARVPERGERVMLANIASIRAGGRYEDGDALITPALEDAVDALSRSMDGFHYGRFDIKFASPEALRAGGFTILEINGAGAEAIQYWDPKYSFLGTFRGVFAKQRALFAMADDMRRMGHRPIGWRALARAHLKQQNLIRRYPPSN